MGSYYYLLAQLPHLLYEQKPPMSSSAFIDLALPLLDEGDAALFKQLSLDTGTVSSGDGYSYAAAAQSTGCDFIDGWRLWERALRLNLAKHRSIKRKLDTPSLAEPPYAPADAAAAAVKAINSATPLDGEIAIDRARWDAIGVLAGNDYFDRNNVFAYFLKLLLIERRQSFDTEKGINEYESLYASIRGTASRHSGGQWLADREQ